MSYISRCLVTLVLLICCVMQLALASPQAKLDGLQLELKQGQLFSIIAPKLKAGGAEHLKSYTKQAFALAKKFGLQNKGALTNQATLVGKHNPSSIAFFTWPNQAAETAFTKHPKWPAIKALRPLAWDELKVFTSEVTADAKLHFKANKFYTIAVAWFNPNRPNDYQQYIKNIEPALTSVGGSFMYKLNNVYLEAHASSTTPPNQITIVEWDTADGLQKLQSNELYQQQLGLLKNGTINFELYLTKV